MRLEAGVQMAQHVTRPSLGKSNDFPLKVHYGTSTRPFWIELVFAWGQKVENGYLSKLSAQSMVRSIAWI